MPAVPVAAGVRVVPAVFVASAVRVTTAVVVVPAVFVTTAVRVTTAVFVPDPAVPVAAVAGPRAPPDETLAACVTTTIESESAAIKAAAAANTRAYVVMVRALLRTRGDRQDFPVGLEATISYDLTSGNASIVRYCQTLMVTTVQGSIDHRTGGDRQTIRPIMRKKAPVERLPWPRSFAEGALTPRRRKPARIEARATSRSGARTAASPSTPPSTACSRRSWRASPPASGPGRPSPTTRQER